MKRIILFILFIFLFPPAISLFGLLMPQRINSSLHPKDLNLEYRDVSIKTDDNLSLSGWYLPSSEGIIIMIHGYPADKGDLLPLAMELYPAFSILLVDMRYFGDSQGRITTLGVKERKDVSNIISWAEREGYEDIGIFGFSFGGAISLLGGGKDDRVSAIATYNSFSDLKTLGREIYKIFFPFNWIMIEIMDIMATPIIGESPKVVSPLKEIKDITSPFLVIHNKEDKIISTEHSKKLKEANPLGEFIFIEGLGHNNLHIETGNILKEFFKKHYENK